MKKDRAKLFQYFGLFLLLLTVSVAHSAEPAAVTRPSRSTKPTYAERFSVIADCNIFVRQRTRSSSSNSSRGTASSTQPAEVSPGKRIALRGVTVDEPELRAFFESAGESRILRLGVGDKIGEGTIVRIELDGVDYQVGDRITRIAIGQDLTGGKFIPAVSSGDAAASSPASEAGLSLEERMKLRRQRESQAPQ